MGKNEDRWQSEDSSKWQEDADTEDYEIERRIELLTMRLGVKADDLPKSRPPPPGGNMSKAEIQRRLRFIEERIK